VASPHSLHLDTLVNRAGRDRRGTEDRRELRQRLARLCGLRARDVLARQNAGWEWLQSPSHAANDAQWTEWIEVGGDGVIHLAYGERVAGPGNRYSIHYARWMGRGRSFAPQEVSRPHTHRFGSMSFPGSRLGAPHSVYLVWELYPLRGNRPRGLGFTHSDDGGRSFHPLSVVPGSLSSEGVNGSLQRLLMEKIAANAAGRLRNGSFGRISLVGHPASFSVE
jgi:hypothetical protein